MKSKFLTLNVKDFLKGLLMAVYGAATGALFSLVQAWYTAYSTHAEFHFDFTPVIVVSVGAALAYLQKNLFTNSSDEPLKTEPPTPPIH